MPDPQQPTRRPPPSIRRRAQPGLLYGRGVRGKYRIKVRQRHVADHLALLVAKKATDAAKLDIVLRGVALLPEDAGNRKTGLVLPHYGYEDLHDLVRDPDRYGPAGDDEEYSPLVRKAKRKWVGEQLERLEALNLVQRSGGAGRPDVIVLRDDGSREPFDAPTGAKREDWYVTVHGTLISTQTIRGWGAPELCFYLAAMIAERSGRKVAGREIRPGEGQWFRTLDWFADPEKRRPEGSVRIPFSVPNLERGRDRLRKDGFVASRIIYRDPDTQQKFKRPRNLYTNRFWTLDYQEETPEIRKIVQALDVEDPVSLLGLQSGVPTTDRAH